MILRHLASKCVWFAVVVAAIACGAPSEQPIAGSCSAVCVKLCTGSTPAGCDSMCNKIVPACKSQADAVYACTDKAADAKCSSNYGPIADSCVTQNDAYSKCLLAELSKDASSE